MRYLFYFLLYTVEMVKFYIIFKDYFAFQERKLGKKEVVSGILLMAGIAFFMADCHSDINPLFVYVPFVILEGWILFHAPFFKFVICSLFPRATSRADVPAHPFGDCREGRIPRSSAALQV